MPEARAHFRRELARLESQALGGLDMVVQSLDRALETVEHRDIELASVVIEDDDRVDGATSRSTKGSSPCWRSRRRWPPTSAWWPPSCT
jgi:hypothetical protein